MRIDELAPAIEASMLACVMDIGCDLPSSIQAAESSEKYDFIYAAVGFHPAEIGGMDNEALDTIKKLAARPKVKAIGEIGLDYYWDDNPPRPAQRDAFAAQIELAKELKLPICIHSRDAVQDTLDVLRACKAFESIPVLMHCYSYSVETARELLDLGCMFSLGGPVTYKNAKKTVDVARMLPLGRLLIETDSPYLSPVPFRGKMNTPLNVEYVARKIAEIKELSFEEVAISTMNNALKFYGITAEF